jgi:hypothetical protein
MQGKKKKPGAFEPLTPQETAFALAVCDGAKLGQAAKLAGYSSERNQAWQRRHKPHIAAFIEKTLQERVQASTRTFAKRLAAKGDLQARTLKELELLAFSDVRQFVHWKREPAVNAHGEVTGIETDVQLRDSAEIPPEAARVIKRVTRRDGLMQVEMHDKQSALFILAKTLGMLSEASAPPETPRLVAADQNAMEAARRVAFMLAMAKHNLPPLIEGKAIEERVESRVDDSLDSKTIDETKP